MINIEWMDRMDTNSLFVGDCLKILPTLPSGCIDLIATDPPFNIGYHYDGYDDRQSRADYLAFTDRWLSDCVRLLAPTGSLFVAIGDDYAAEVKVRLDALGLTMRNWLIWHYTFGVHCTRKFTRSHTHILYYVKDAKRFTFNADAVRVPSARQTKYADRRAHPAGRIPDDVWQFSRVCGTFRERREHPCQMPEALVERIVRVASNPGDLVLDPFAGSGTTLAVAARLGRRWLGIERSPRYASVIHERLNALVANDQPTVGHRVGTAVGHAPAELGRKQPAN